MRWVRCGNVILPHLETAGDAGSPSGVAAEELLDSSLLSLADGDAN
jgi:hypothetical protein